MLTEEQLRAMTHDQLMAEILRLRSNISAGELAALAALANNDGYEEAARSLGKSPKTLGVQRDSACRKLGRVSTTRAILLALDQGLLAWDAEAKKVVVA